MKIFALEADWINLLLILERNSSIAYTQTGHIKEEDYVVYSSVQEIFPLRESLIGDNLKQSYLLYPSSTVLALRSIGPSNSGVRAIDQLTNPQSIVIVFGGIFEGFNCLAGSVDSANQTEWAKDIFSNLRRAFKDLGFKNVKGHMIGPGLTSKLTKNWRLMFHKNGPVEYDLKFSLDELNHG